MLWSELRAGDVFVSRRSDKVRVVLSIESNELITGIEFFSVTSQRRGETIKGRWEELDPEHYEVHLAGDRGQ